MNSGNSALRLGTSTYSYWHFTPEKTPIESVLDAAAELGLSGVEILHRQMESEENAYLQKLKRHAFTLGLDLYNLSIHQDFVHDDAAVRQQQIDHTLHCIDLAHEMGIPSIRVNSGGFRKQGSFDDLIAAKGWVEPREGFTMDDGFNWVIDSIERCLPHAERRGVLLLLENHWGLTTFASDMARIIETIDSPWLQAILDMGNFLFEDDMYAAMERVAPTCVSPTPRPTQAGAPGTASTSTTPASSAFSSTPAGAATARSRWKARRTPLPPSPRASRCCANPGKVRRSPLRFSS